jgi:hypothetical protein
MENKNIITKNTELKPKDLLKSSEGKIYQIDSQFGGKNNFRIFCLENPKASAPLFMFMSREAMILNSWEKLEQGKVAKAS